MTSLKFLLILTLIIDVFTEPQLLGGILSAPESKTQSSSGLLNTVLSSNVLGLANINISTNPNNSPLSGITTSTNNDDMAHKSNNIFTIANLQNKIPFTGDDIIRNKNNKPMKITNENCIFSKTFSSSQKTCQGQLIFEETFETNKLNTKVWSKEIRIPSDYDDGDFISYQDLPENCYIKNNQLYIVPTLLQNTDGYNVDSIRSGTLNLDDRCTTIDTSNFLSECTRTGQYSRILPPIVSARIGTRKSFSFRYGRIEIKAKLPKGDWIFPQLLLEPYSIRPYGERGYASGQIRIAFVRGNEILYDKNNEQIDGNRLYGGVILTVGEEKRDIFLKSTIHHKHLGDDYHIYSMTWTNESIIFEMDGNVYGKIYGGFGNNPNLMNLKQSEIWRNSDFMAPFDREFFISLGVSAGGISDFPDNSRNGARRKQKPWINKDPKSELRFWNDRGDWLRTWNGDDVGLKVDYIRVWALNEGL